MSNKENPSEYAKRGQLAHSKARYIGWNPAAYIMIIEFVETDTQ